MATDAYVDAFVVPLVDAAKAYPEALGRGHREVYVIPAGTPEERKLWLQYACCYVRYLCVGLVWPGHPIKDSWNRFALGLQIYWNSRDAFGVQGAWVYILA